jgi:hypothetical protein
MVRGESEPVTKNGKDAVPPEGIALAIVDGLEGLSTIARDQTAESFKQGEKVVGVLRDQSILTIRAAEALGVSALSAFGEVAMPMVPRLPLLSPVSNIDAVVKAGFDVAQQLLASQRKLTESAVGLVAALAA